MSVNWGIVGTGNHADTVMAPAINTTETARLLGAVSRDPARAEEFCRRHGATRPWTRYEDLLADPEIDAVLITTPNALHADQVVAAASAGKHVLCDKPLALSSEDAIRAVHACQTSGVRLGINFQMRHAGWARQARDLIASGVIGRVLIVQAEQAPGRAGGLRGWRADPSLAGLGSVNNIAVHLYDLIRFITGSEVIEVSAMFDTGTSGGLETLAMTLFRLENGGLVYVNGNQLSMHPQNDVDVYGSTGRIRATNLSRHLLDGELHVVTQEEERSTRETTGDVFQRVIVDFCQAVVEGREPLAGGVDGLRSVELTEAIARSARERAVVSVARGEA